MMDNEQLPKGYKNTEVGVIPEDWEVAQLKCLTTLITDGAHLSPPTEKNGYPIATVENINKGYIDLDSCRVISSKDYQYLVRNNCKPIIGDVLLSKDGTIGITFSIKKEEDVVLLSSIAIIRPQKEKLDSIFLSKSFSSEWFYLFLDRVKAGSALTRIVLRDIKKYIFPLPPTKSEQTAIATALSDADALINSLEKLIAKKRNIKQGAMQQLLKPQEGWEVKKLGEIAFVNMGQSPLSEYYNSEGIGLPLVQGNADVENRKTIIRFFTSMITKRGKVGDIIMSVRAPVGEIAKATFECCLGRGVCSISFDNEFLYHYLIYFEKSWAKLSTGSTFDSVNSKQVKELEIPIPISKQEQTRIATILSDMDAEIQALETKLEKYRKIKLGMMQNLLTGKIRLV